MTYGNQTYHQRKVEVIAQSQEFSDFIESLGWNRNDNHPGKHYTKWTNAGHHELSMHCPCEKHDCGNENRVTIFANHREYIFEPMYEKPFYFRDCSVEPFTTQMYEDKERWEAAWKPWVFGGVLLDS